MKNYGILRINMEFSEKIKNNEEKTYPFDLIWYLGIHSSIIIEETV